MTRAELVLGAPVEDLWSARPAGEPQHRQRPAGQSQLFDPDAPQEGNHDPMDVPRLPSRLPLPPDHSPRRATR